MTPDRDNVSKLINEHPGSSLGFSDTDYEVTPREAKVVNKIKGRKGKIKTPQGTKAISGTALTVIAPTGLHFIPGGGAPIDIDQLTPILTVNSEINEAKAAIAKDKKRRKEKLNKPKK